jgi:nucleoid-associated protein YgaU
MELPQLTGFERASLVIEDGQTIECWFNPKEYTVAKQNTWTAKSVPGKALPPAEYGGGQPRKLSLDLFFDSSDTAGSVTDVTDALLHLMEADSKFATAKNSARPPTVTFAWGRKVQFKAVIESLSIQYTLFGPDGLPLRAQAKLSLMQADKAQGKWSGKGNPKPGNPTTRAIPGIGSHVVRDGDSLASIAYAHYADATKWRAIAEANGIDDPLRIRRGAVLSIPRLSG